MDKLFMYLFYDKKDVSAMHRKLSLHHENEIEKFISNVKDVYGDDSIDVSVEDIKNIFVFFFIVFLCISYYNFINLS